MFPSKSIFIFDDFLVIAIDPQYTIVQFLRSLWFLLLEPWWVSLGIGLEISRALTQCSALMGALGPENSLSRHVHLIGHVGGPNQRQPGSVLSHCCYRPRWQVKKRFSSSRVVFTGQESLGLPLTSFPLSCFFLAFIFPHFFHTTA